MLTLLQQVRANRAALKSELDTINATVSLRADKQYTPGEDIRFEEILREIRGMDRRIEELENGEAMRGAADVVAREEQAAARGSGWSVGREPNPVYRLDGRESYLRDMAAVKLGFEDATDARQRLIASQETRAGDMTTSAAAGGTFAPPGWYIDQFVALARPGRVAADLMQHDELPPGVSSINLPKVASGTTTAVQQTQNFRPVSVPAI